MWLSALKDEDITPAVIQKLLFDGVDDRTGERGDCILVLGGLTPFIDRVPKAVSMYKSGLAKKLILSGGPEWDSPYGRLSEAAVMAACAKELGVPEEDIILDELAATTIENMICGALAIGRSMKFPGVKKLLLVTSWCHMRRAKLFADLFLPRHFECVCCPADGITGPEDDWQNDPEKLHEAVCEVQRIRKMVHQGYIGDIEI